MLLEGHLYLPTNPDTRVTSIDATSSAPMKSHAKVPVLVNFFVEDELYELAHERETRGRDSVQGGALNTQGSVRRGGRTTGAQRQGSVDGGAGRGGCFAQRRASCVTGRAAHPGLHLQGGRRRSSGHDGSADHRAMQASV